MLILDANIILRYLLDDNIQLATKAEEYIHRCDAFVTVEVVAEVVYVLKGIYSLERERINDILSNFLDIVKCEHKDALKIGNNSALKLTLYVICVSAQNQALRPQAVVMS